MLSPKTSEKEKHQNNETIVKRFQKEKEKNLRFDRNRKEPKEKQRRVQKE
jgi:hypothetical protein